MVPRAKIKQLQTASRHFTTPLLVAAALAGVPLLSGCDQTADTDYEKAVEAQAELEKAREEAAEKVAQAEAEAIENVQEAREEAQETIQESKQEAAEMVQNAEQKLQERLEKLSEKPLAPPADAAAPREEPEVVVERKVTIEENEPREEPVVRPAAEPQVD